MKKAGEMGDNPYLELFNYRNNPVDGFATSTQLFISHQVKSIIPCVPKKLVQKVVSTSTFVQHHQAAQAQQKMYHDQHAKLLRPLHSGNTVHYKNIQIVSGRVPKWLP
jgi:hypothetical protein